MLQPGINSVYYLFIYLLNLFVYLFIYKFNLLICFGCNFCGLPVLSFNSVVSAQRTSTKKTRRLDKFLFRVKMWNKTSLHFNGGVRTHWEPQKHAFRHLIVDILKKNQYFLLVYLSNIERRDFWIVNMAMIETVRERQRNATDFGFYYGNLCALQDSCPLGTITANLDEHIIDCNADRIRANDWIPIWNALKINKSLRRVAFRSYWQQLLFPDNGEFINT